MQFAITYQHIYWRSKMTMKLVLTLTDDEFVEIANDPSLTAQFMAYAQWFKDNAQDAEMVNTAPTLERADGTYIELQLAGYQNDDPNAMTTISYKEYTLDV